MRKYARVKELDESIMIGGYYTCTNVHHTLSVGVSRFRDNEIFEPAIMRAAMDVGTKIPKLCATDMLEAFGSCRLCLVEIQGRAGTPASCTTPVG